MLQTVGFIHFCAPNFWHDGASLVPASSNDSYMILSAGRNKASVMPIYRRICRFNVTVHLLILFTIHKYPIYSLTTLTAMQESEVIANSICRYGYKKRAISGKSSSANGAFTPVISFLFYNIVFLSWLLFLFLYSSDVH